MPNKVLPQGMDKKQEASKLTLGSNSTGADRINLRTLKRKQTRQFVSEFTETKAPNGFVLRGMKPKQLYQSNMATMLQG